MNIIKEKGISKTIVRKRSLGNKKGWTYEVYFGREYPNLIGGLYTSQRKATEALTNYIETGKIEFYGNAE